MNVYTITKCPNCGKGIILEGEVMCHGGRAADEAVKMLNVGVDINDVKKRFCSYCGGRLPCGCSKPSPQA